MSKRDELDEYLRSGAGFVRHLEGNRVAAFVVGLESQILKLDFEDRCYPPYDAARRWLASAI